MTINRLLKNNAKIIAVAIPALIILLPLGYSVVSYVLAHGSQSSPPFIERPDKKYQSCVKETTYMRFHHMDLLKEIREDVVREGKRGEIGLAIGLNNCRKCHASRERFCNQCHNAVNLHLDCFGCHYYPEAPEIASAEAHSTKTTQASYRWR